MARSLTHRIVRAVILSQVVLFSRAIAASLTLQPEDDARLGTVIGICGWTIAILVAWWDFAALSRSPEADSGGRRFGMRGLFLVVTLAAMAAWLAKEVHDAEYRRSLIEAFESRGGWRRVGRVPGHWVTKSFVAPAGEFSSEELFELQDAFPDAKLEVQVVPLVFTP